MTVRRGEDWGALGALDPGAPVADDDRSLNEIVAAGFDECGLTGGDLARTVGARASAPEIRAGTDRPRLPIDVGRASIDGVEVVFTSHLVVRGMLWSHVSAVFNAAFLGRWNIAPRAHPNDGRLDLFVSSLGPVDRLKARRRLPNGTHVPHPHITQRRVTDGEIAPHRSAVVWIDGRRVGRAERVVYWVEPDAFTIVV